MYFILWKGTELWRTPLVLQLPSSASHLEQHWGRGSNLHFVRGTGVKLSFSTTWNLPHFRKPERIISFGKSQQSKPRVLKMQWTGIWSLALSLHHSFAYSLSNEESKNKHEKVYIRAAVIVLLSNVSNLSYCCDCMNKPNLFNKLHGCVLLPRK